MRGMDGIRGRLHTGLHPSNQQICYRTREPVSSSSEKGGANSGRQVTRMLEDIPWWRITVRAIAVRLWTSTHKDEPMRLDGNVHIGSLAITGSAVEQQPLQGPQHP